jgi:hypothetical protein
VKYHQYSFAYDVNKILMCDWNDLISRFLSSIEQKTKPTCFFNMVIYMFLCLKTIVDIIKIDDFWCHLYWHWIKEVCKKKYVRHPTWLYFYHNYCVKLFWNEFKSLSFFDGISGSTWVLHTSITNIIYSWKANDQRFHHI